MNTGSPLWLVAGWLVAASLPSPAGAAADLCDRLFVPEGYHLRCTLERDPSGGGLAAVVRPEDGTFASLSELTLRRIDEPVDVPAQWLRDQLTLDLSQVDSAIEDMARGDDSPLTGTPLADQLESWRGLLGEAATLPLAGCDEPEALRASDAWEMACAWELGPIRQFMRLRVVERGGEHYAIRMQTMNERRLRHLAAIANSF